MEARRAALTIALALLPGLLSAGDVELFPDATIQLQGAYYIPPEDAFVWDAWIGAGAGLLRVRTATVYVTADVETVLGRERRAFDANQVNDHLEGGLRIRVGRHLVIPFFHHVSRHVVDRPKDELVDWNLLGAGVAGSLPAASSLRGRYAASVAHTVEWRTVGYEWELIGAFDVDLYRRSWGALYLRAGTRFVTVSPETGIPRGDFADVIAETGARLGRTRASWTSSWPISIATTSSCSSRVRGIGRCWDSGSAWLRTEALGPICPAIGSGALFGDTRQAGLRASGRAALALLGSPSG